MTVPRVSFCINSCNRSNSHKNANNDSCPQSHYQEHVHISKNADDYGEDVIDDSAEGFVLY